MTDTPEATATPARLASPLVPLTALALASAIVVTTEFIVIGMLPAMARDLEITLAAAGRLVTWFALAAALFGPPLTLAANRFDARTALLAALAVFCVGNLAVATISSYLTLVLVRLMQGAALPLFIAIANTGTASLAGPGNAGKAIALVNTGVVASTIIGLPAAAFFAEHAGWQAGFFTLFALGLAAIALVAAVLKEQPATKRNPVAEQTRIIRRPAFQAHLLLSGLTFTAMFAAYTYLAAFLAEVAGLSSRGVSLALLGFGLTGLAGNWLAGHAVDKDPTLTTAGTMLAVAGTLPAASVAGGGLLTLLPLLGIWGAAHAATFVANQVRVMLAGAEAPAFATALNISVCNLGIALGAVIGGWIVARHGIRAVGFGSAGIALSALALAMGLRGSAGVRRLTET